MQVRAREYIEQVVQHELEKERMFLRLIPGDKQEYETAMRYRIGKALEKLKFPNLTCFIGREKQKVIKGTANCYLDWLSCRAYGLDMRAIRAAGVPNNQVIFAVESEMMWMESMRCIFDAGFLRDEDARLKHFRKIAGDVSFDKDYYNQVIAQAEEIVKNWQSTGALDEIQLVCGMKKLLPDGPALVEIYIKEYKLEEPLVQIIMREMNLFLPKIGAIIAKPVADKKKKEQIFEALDYLHARWLLEKRIAAHWIEDGFEPEPMPEITLEGLTELHRAKKEPGANLMGYSIFASHDI